MIFIRTLAFLTIFISSATYAQTNEQTNANGQTNALIIFRHAQDLANDKWQKNCSMQLTAEEAKKYGITCDKEKWKYNNFRDPQAQPVLIPWRRLLNNDDTNDKYGNKLKNGITQAQKIADQLPAWLNANGYSPINRVITKDPRPYDSTSNPFQTVAPLVLTLDKDERNYSSERGYVRLKFFKDMSDDEVTQSALFDGTEFSSVLCWDAEGLWGKKDGDYPATMLSDSILGRLLTEESIEDINNLGKPGKAKEIYILVYDKELKKFTVDHVLDLDDMQLIW